MFTTLLRVSSPTFSSVCRPSQLLDHVKKDSPVVYHLQEDLPETLALARAEVESYRLDVISLKWLHLKECQLLPCLPHQGIQPKNPIGIPQLPQRDVVIVEGWAEHLFVHQDQCSDLS